MGYSCARSVVGISESRWLFLKPHRALNSKAKSGSEGSSVPAGRQTDFGQWTMSGWGPPAAAGLVLLHLRRAFRHFDQTLEQTYPEPPELFVYRTHDALQSPKLSAESIPRFLCVSVAGAFTSLSVCFS